MTDNPLAQLLSDNPLLKPYLHSSDRLDGILFGVAASPEIPLPMTWLPWLFIGPPPESMNGEIEAVMNTAMERVKGHLQRMRSGSKLLPTQCVFPDETDNQGPLSQWCLGVLQAHQQLEPDWQQSWDEMQRQDPQEAVRMQKLLRRALSMLTTFANMSLAIEQSQARGQDDLAAKLPQLYLSLDSELNSYVDVSGALVEHLPDQFETFSKTT